MGNDSSKQLYTDRRRYRAYRADRGMVAANGLRAEQSLAGSRYSPHSNRGNLSAKQFGQKNLTVQIKQILAEAELDPKYLELEITENLAMKDDKLSTLQELRNMGITISIDDFGTQYSSLSYLKRLPVNKIKIDRSFVNGISKDRKDEAIILAMLLIARRLDLTVIAEGVETKAQLLFLQTHKCNDVQGFLFYKPQSAEFIGEILLKQSAAPINPSEWVSES